MKKLILNYLGVLLVALSIGVIVGLIVKWSWLCAFLFSFVISFGWIPIAGFNKRSPVHPDGAALLIGFSLTVQLLLLMYGAYEMDLKSFLGLAYSISLGMAAMLTLVLAIKVKAAFRERIEKEEQITGFKLRKGSIRLYSDASF